MYSRQSRSIQVSGCGWLVGVMREWCRREEIKVLVGNKGNTLCFSISVLGEWSSSRAQKKSAFIRSSQGRLGNIGFSIRFAFPRSSKRQRPMRFCDILAFGLVEQIEYPIQFNYCTLDFVRRGEPPDAKPEAGSRQLVADAKRCEYVARLGASRRTSSPLADCQIP